MWTSLDYYFPKNKLYELSSTLTNVQDFGLTLLEINNFLRAEERKTGKITNLRVQNIRNTTGKLEVEWNQPVKRTC